MTRHKKTAKTFAHTAPACATGKLTFALEAEADEAAASVTRRNLRRPRESGRTAARSYQCEACGHFHVTSQEYQATRTEQAVSP